jgi:hypothetical protein
MDIDRAHGLLGRLCDNMDAHLRASPFPGRATQPDKRVRRHAVVCAAFQGNVCKRTAVIQMHSGGSFLRYNSRSAEGVAMLSTLGRSVGARIAEAPEADPEGVQVIVPFTLVETNPDPWVTLFGQLLNAADAHATLRQVALPEGCVWLTGAGPEDGPVVKVARVAPLPRHSMFPVLAVRTHMLALGFPVGDTGSDSIVVRQHEGDACRLELAGSSSGLQVYLLGTTQMGRALLQDVASTDVDRFARWLQMLLTQMHVAGSARELLAASPFVSFEVPSE